MLISLHIKHFCFFVEVCLEPFYTNGHIETAVNKTYTTGDTVSVICDTGFKALSLNTTCNQSRFWDPHPACTIVTCPAPTVYNGNYTAHNYDQQQNDNINKSTMVIEYKFNITIFLQCDDKFEADGPTTFKCLADGSWGQEISTCVKILCNNTSDVSEAAVIKIPTDLGIGEMGNVSYNPLQYHLSDGVVQVKCHDNRSLTWTKKPNFGMCGLYKYVLLFTYNIYLYIMFPF